MPSIIQTKRLILRNMLEDDATEEYVGWLNDYAVNKYLETRHELQTLEMCRQFIRSCNHDTGSHLFGVFLASNGKHIGNAKIGFINPIHGSAELSLFIGDKNYWGMGFGAEIVKSLTNYSFETLGLAKLEAGCYEGNISSLRAFLKVGYVVEGFLRSHVILENKRQGCFLLGVTKFDDPY